MRPIWTRATGTRLLLLVAAISTVGAVASSPIHSATQADCSKATAHQVATQFGLTDQVAQVFCGAFVGPGSQAMVVAFTPGTCGINGWAVFGFAGGAWHLVGLAHSGWTFAVAAVGTDIRETAPVPTGTFHCPLLNGTPRWRIWHWDGTRLVAGPWKQAPVRNGFFHTPSGNIECGLSDQRELVRVDCWSFRRPQRAKLYAGGRVTICRGSEARCRIGNAGEQVPTLGYGRQITVGRFRCVSRRSGVTCTVISLGKGFLINRDRVMRVG